MHARSLALTLAGLFMAPVAPAYAPETSGVRDTAHMFSEDAVQQAGEKLAALEEKHHLQVVVETVETTAGKPIDELARAKAPAGAGSLVYVLLAHKEHKAWVIANEPATKRLGRGTSDAVKQKIVAAFKENAFDRGLAEAVTTIAERAQTTPPKQAEAGDPAPTTQAKEKKLSASGPVRDGANMFSAEAQRKADAKLREIQQRHGWKIIVETIESTGDKPIARLASDRARTMRIEGVYLLLAKKEHKVEIEVNAAASKVFGSDVKHEVVNRMVAAFKEREYDRGLLEAVDYLGQVGDEHGQGRQATGRAAPARGEPPAQPPAAQAPNAGRGSFLVTILVVAAVIIGVLFVIRLIARLVGGGGYGRSYGPGGGSYGAAPGGGGFFGSLMGGLGGMLLGGWLYDSVFRNRSYGAELPQHPQAGNEPGTNDQYESAGGDWGTTDAEDPAGSSDEPSGGESSGGDWGGGDSAGGDAGGSDAGGDW